MRPEVGQGAFLWWRAGVAGWGRSRPTLSRPDAADAAGRVQGEIDFLEGTIIAAGRRRLAAFCVPPRFPSAAPAIVGDAMNDYRSSEDAARVH